VELILGVDPGLTRCGYGVITGSIAVDYGHFTSSPTQDPRDRVGSIAESLDRIIKTHKPVLIAVERVFAQANLRSVMGVAQISGALMALAFKHDIPLEFFTPSEIKLAVAGHGRADKAQVSEIVKRTLNLEETPKPADVADALAVAICASKRAQGLGTNAQQKWVAAAKTANRRLG
jgi:crossover junction endodeoxyribonuclease RuvC